VVADAVAAVFAAIAQQPHVFRLPAAQGQALRRLGGDGRRDRFFQAPAHRLQVVDVHVAALAHRLNHLADRTAVLQQLMPDRHVSHGDLVPQRHVFDHRDGAHRHPFQGDDAGFLARVQVAHRDADIVVSFVDDDTV